MLPPPVITRTGAVTPRSRRRASKLKPRLLSESQRPAGRGRDDYVEQDEIERLSSQDLERLRRGLGGGDLIAYPCRNEAKKSRSTVSTIASSSTIRTRFAPVPFGVACTLPADPTYY